MPKLETIKSEFAKHIYLLSYNIIDICLAASVANRLKGPCLCMYIIGPGSTAKTEALHIMSEHPSNYWITDLTEHTLFSGALGGYSLVPQIYAQGVRSILMQDFTLILEKRHDQRQEIISQIRGLADGKFVRDWGMKKNPKVNQGQHVEWNGTLGVIAAVTNAIEDHHAVSNVMGERFLYYRMPETDDTKATDLAMMSLIEDGDSWRPHLQAMTKNFLDKFDKGDEIEVELSRSMFKILQNMAIFTSHARMAVSRDKFGHIMRMPEKEGATRLVKQLTKMCQGLLLVHGKSKTDDEVLHILGDVVWSNMPRYRYRILKHLMSIEGCTLAECSQHLIMPYTTTRNYLENLELCDLVAKNGDNYLISERCRQLVKDAKL